jgi:hypothetical protein
MTRTYGFGVLLVTQLLIPVSSHAQVHDQYDRFADRTVVTLFVLYDSPLLGASKELHLLYDFMGKAQLAPADTVVWVVKLTSVGTASISAGGWKLADRPPLYVLVDDSMRLQYSTAARDWNTNMIGRIGYSLDETVAYPMPTADLARIVDGTRVAIKVGPSERALKPKELARIREFMRRLTNVSDDHAPR